MFKGEKSYTHGDMQSVQYGAVIGQVNLAHQPPTVSFFVLFLFNYFVSYSFLSLYYAYYFRNYTFYSQNILSSVTLHFSLFVF